eukprot:2354800-Pyramimonas_sp.AAC.1
MSYSCERLPLAEYAPHLLHPTMSWEIYNLCPRALLGGTGPDGGNGASGGTAWHLPRGWFPRGRFFEPTSTAPLRTSAGPGGGSRTGAKVTRGRTALRNSWLS